MEANVIFDLEEGEQAIKSGAYRQAFKIFLSLCQSYEDPAYYKVSEMVLNDQLLPEERDQLLTMLGKEVTRHNLEAAFNLAILYWRAPEIRDIRRSAELLALCMRNAMPEAHVALAKLYLGEGKDLPEARSETIMELLLDGFGLGSVEAAWLLARQHMSGTHTERNDFLAFKWLCVAGRLGHEEARKHALMMEGLRPAGAYAFVREEALELVNSMEASMVRFR
jgi:TPR repeat protein